MRHDDEREAFWLDPFRQREVRRNLEAVRRLVADGRHRRQRLARQLLPYDVLLRRLLGVPVEQVHRAGIDVGARDDDVEPLVPGRGLEADLLAGELLLQQVVVGLPSLVLPDVARLVDDVIRHVREDHVAQIDAILRIGFDDLFFARLHVEEREPGEIGALVRFEIDARTVFMKVQRPACFEYVAAVDLREAVVVDTEYFRVAVFGDTRREAQLVRQVELPVDEPFGVLAQERPLAGRDADLVEVVPRLVAIVEADVDQIRIGLGHEVDARLHALRVGDVARGGDVAAGGRLIRRLDGVHVEVLVAELILGVEHVLRVPALEVRGDRPLGIGGDRFGLIECLVGSFHPDVARPLEGLEEGQELAVGRNLRARDLGIAEEKIAVDDWWHSGGRRRGRATSLR